MSFIETNFDGPVARLTLNRPERHNSLVPELLDELLAALRIVAAREDVSAVVLAAKGRSFSTGGDLSGFLAHWDDIESYSRRIVGGLNEVVLAMLRLPQPIVAAVQGWTTGGSLGLVLGADVVLLAPDARFAPFYTEVGFSPDGGWCAILPERIGRGLAAEIQYRNLTLDAETAVARGLANRVVPAAALAGEAESVARSIARMVPESVRSTKRLLNIDLDRVERGLAAELEAFVERIKASGTYERAAAFVNRIKAV